MDIIEYDLIYGHIREQNNHWNGESSKRPTARFVDLIREYGVGGPSGQKYLPLTKSVRPFFDRFELELPTSNADASREIRDNVLREIRKGKKPAYGPAFVAWLMEHPNKNARTAFRDFLTEIGYDLPDDRFQIRYDAFLCWAGPYAHAIAEEIASFLHLYSDHISAFLSSRDIADGHWQPQLMAGLHESSRGLVLATQDALDSEYLTHEVAALGTIKTDNGNKPTARIILLDAPYVVLSEPLQDYQRADFSRKSLRLWLDDLFADKGVKFKETDFDALWAGVESVSDKFQRFYVTPDEHRWEGNLHRPLLFTDQNSSPYDLEQVLNTTQQHLTLVAQNHWFMTVSPDGGDRRFWPLVEDALRRGVNLQIVGMYERVEPSHRTGIKTPSAYDLWTAYMNAGAFREHTEQGWEVLKSWKDRYRELASEDQQTMGSLDIYGAYFTPLTMSIVDPDSDRGYAVVSPRTGHSGSGARPHFIIRAKHEAQVFRYYQQTVEEGIANGGWKKLFE